MRRIGIFTDTYWPSVNGVAVSVANLREGLRKRGYRVYVFAPRVPGSDHGAESVGVYRFPSFRPPKKPDYPIAVPSIRLLRIIQELELDLIHAHHPYWVGRWGLWWARRKKIPAIETVHTNYGLYAGYSPLPEEMTVDFMERELIRSCHMADLVTTPGEGSRQRLLGQGIKTPIICVSNPTKIGEFAKASGLSIRQRFNIGSDEILFGYVGRLNAEKNLPVLIEAFKRIADSNPKARFLIVGDGTERALLESMAVSLGVRVDFAGKVDHSEVAEYFAAINCFVTPSESEVQPMSFAEAFATGTPIIAFDVTGCNDMVKPGVSGTLVPLEEGAVGLASAALELVADASRLRLMTDSCRDWSKRYDQDVAVESMLSVYKLAWELAEV